MHAVDGSYYFQKLQLVAIVSPMDDAKPHEPELLSPGEAQHLLDLVPSRPRREFRIGDHLSTAATVALSLIAGALALGGYPWWAAIPALCAIINAHTWISKRLNRANEPRLRPTFISAAFTVWVLIPVWRGVRHGETIPFPEAWLFAGLAPGAWLVFYLVLLIRR